MIHAISMGFTSKAHASWMVEEGNCVVMTRYEKLVSKTEHYLHVKLL
jgi:hypothetical protein